MSSNFPTRKPSSGKTVGGKSSDLMVQKKKRKEFNQGKNLKIVGYTADQKQNLEKFHSGRGKIVPGVLRFGFLGLWEWNSRRSCMRVPWARTYLLGNSGEIPVANHSLTSRNPLMQRLINPGLNRALLLRSLETRRNSASRVMYLLTRIPICKLPD